MELRSAATRGNGGGLRVGLGSLGLVVVSAAVLGWLVACAPSGPSSKVSNPQGVCADGVRRLDAESIEVCADLNVTTLETFRKLISDNDRYVYLTSNGGRPEIALLIVEEINRRGIEVRLRDVCFSACAQVVFMGADRVDVSDDTIVAFHHSATLLYRYFSEKDEPAALDALRPGSSAERDLYRRKGIAESFLLQPAVVLEPLCIGYNPSAARDKTSIRTRHWMIMPPREKMNAIRGRPVIGYWPKGSKDLARAFERMGKNPKPGYTIGVGWPRSKTSEAAISDAISTTPRC